MKQDKQKSNESYSMALNVKEINHGNNMLNFDVCRISFKNISLYVI